MSCYITIAFLLTYGLYKSALGGVLNAEACPTNCICYPDALSNLASWEWIESDIHLNPDDPDSTEFNPYTEHNEVYENPRASLKTKEVFNTVTCVLRNDASAEIAETFRKIPSTTQVLSVLQAAGSGNITIGRSHFGKLSDLIGIDIQGYKGPKNEVNQRPNSFRLEADAFLSLKKLTYLSLDNVLLQQRSVVEKPNTEQFISKIVSIRKTGSVFNSTEEESSSEVLNDLESQLIFLSPKKSNEILPYSEYRTGSRSWNKGSIEPKEKPPEPKVAVAFTDIPSLLHLRISQCNMQHISWDMFHRLHGLKFLLLENNDLLFLPDFLFYSTSNLTTLSLSGNRILSLQTVGLAGLLYLQKLDVTHNNITHLSELSLPPFPHLEVADFRHNPIETIYPNTFEVMNTTKSLYLGNPLIPLQIFPNSFYGLTSLMNLEITNIRIDFLERPMFKGLPNLRVLEMNGQIKRISYDAFSEIPNLEKLSMRKCGIEKISMDAFFGLTTLLELDLSHNRISMLPPGIFDEQSSLREIYLQHNQLTTLPSNLFLKSPSKLIRLEGNPWHCSCDMTSWNPGKINQVKSYYIPTGNDTHCQRQFDKGSMCTKSLAGFTAKYVYEKRVSPVCETPKKFQQRSVFDVLRKELKYCSSSPPNTKPIKGIKSQSEKKEAKANLLSQFQKVRKPLKEILKAIQKKNFTIGTALSPPTAPTTTQTTFTQEATIDRSVLTQKNPNNETKELTTKEPDSTTVNSISEATFSNHIPMVLLPPPPVEGSIHSPLFKPSKSKLTTPRPLKSTRRNTLMLPRGRPISKKALKFAKLYAPQPPDGEESKGLVLPSDLTRTKPTQL